MIENIVIEKKWEQEVLYIDNAIKAVYRSGDIIFVNLITNNNIWRINLHKYAFEKCLFYSKPLERLLRLQPRYLDRISEKEFILSTTGYLYTINIEKRSLKEVYQYNKGTHNPLSFCKYQRNGIVNIVFGDYGGHDANGNVGIYCFSQGNVDQIGFIRGELVNHIHKVEYDKYRGIYWIFTGDFDAGSGIWTLSPYEQEATPFLLGNQQYRACVSFICRDCIIYATDSPIEKNCIYKLVIKNKSIEKLKEIPGSCIFGAHAYINQNELQFFATAVEPDSTLPTWRYRITNRLGAGIKDRYSHILAGNPAIGYKEIWEGEKDWMPMLLFQFGNVRFPMQKQDNILYFCPQGLKESGTYCIKFRESAIENTVEDNDQ